MAFTEKQICGWEILMWQEEGGDEMNSDKKNDKSHHVHTMSNLIKDKPLKDKKKSPEHSPE